MLVNPQEYDALMTIVLAIGFAASLAQMRLPHEVLDL
jgi:hypothetical protein